MTPAARSLGSATHLLAELAAVLDDGVLSTEEGALDAVSSDATTWLPPQRPVAVVRARTTDDVRAAVRAAAAARVPVITRGAGTGLSGGARPLAEGIVLDLSAMNRILELDPTRRTARVQAGVVTAELDRAAARLGLMFAPDPASAARSTVGGNIATNAGGLRRIKYGSTRQSVLSLTVVLASGEVERFGAGTPKDVTGLDLLGLMVGSEGTLGVVVEATVALVPRPDRYRMLAIPCTAWTDVQRAVETVMASPVTPGLFELMDGGIDRTRAAHWTRLGFADSASALLLVQTDGPAADAEAESLRWRLADAGLTADVLTEGARLEALAVRIGEVVASAEPEWWLGEDMTVPTGRLAEFFDRAHAIAADAGVRLALVAHVGDGNVHPSLSVARTATDEPDARSRLHAAADALIRLALTLGGALTGEHGVGRLKQEWLDVALSPGSRELQRSIKSVLDPAGILNPGCGL